jgi:hypothetical protein
LVVSPGGFTSSFFLGDEATGYRLSLHEAGCFFSFPSIKSGTVFVIQSGQAVVKAVIKTSPTLSFDSRIFRSLLCLPYVSPPTDAAKPLFLGSSKPLLDLANPVSFSFPTRGIDVHGAGWPILPPSSPCFPLVPSLNAMQSRRWPEGEADELRLLPMLPCG